ncbi:Germinal-center associated nuclear protein [Portunus trituberculatus]|uniref:Germinal-center associated nuclear protein n=1 Tax=Portunus trituberculatus TaxID=210409 RepID=A0A5B7DGU1_PORTR|nr:Germinal-center associated nuclear protein [Portunus trituberculatus]
MGEGSNAPQSTTTNTTTTTMPRFTPLFTPNTQGQTGAFPTPFGSSLRPLTSLAMPPSLARDTTTSTAGGIFGSAQVNATVPASSLFGGTKRPSDAMARDGEQAAADNPGSGPLLVGPAASSVFGGGAGVAGGGFGVTLPLPKIFGGSGSEGVSTMFSGAGGGSGGGDGVGGQEESLFGQVTAPPPPPPHTDLFKEARMGEADPSAAGRSPSKVFGGGGSTSGVLVPSVLGKDPLAPFSSPEGKAKAHREAAKAEAAGVSPAPAKASKASKGQGQDERQSSPPEYNKKEVTKVIVADIPDSCLDRDVLKTHFSKFGDIKRLVLNARARQATVIYATHHAASRAKRRGCKLHPMLPEVEIYYGTPARRRSDDAGSSNAVQAKKKAIRTLQQVHQSTDLDPYTPLQRPSTDPTPLPLLTKKPLKARIARATTKAAQPPPPSPPSLSPAAKRLSAPKTKVRSKSPGREAKEASTVTADEGNLAAVLECTAQNNNDRYTILKARDKLLRRERHRTSDLQQATYLAATCPDMCPELERYMRDVQCDLSTTFETTAGVLDHRLATKKFSRSSADKELPLPHELRPGPVLLRTMDFLVCNVMGRVDEADMEADVWYNYLWNRTRAVRNDLMQQQLVNGDAVAIMERCTRFHIYAAERLCEEPADLYDDKMNTEHLTKSLQTLKELYHDLAEQGCHFPSEAEFRAYEMLLSLNDGEAIVNKYAQFRDEVQKSPAVQFAQKVILAVTFNNYVKFFRLVRESATFLQGCLLLRYFRQVRSRALETMVRSYMPRKGPQTIPLAKVTHILGFESEQEAVEFLRCHGITANDGAVSLDRHCFIRRPEEVPPSVRPVALVEVNRFVSVEEVIQGCPVPPNPLHTHVPHDSFDQQGCLKPEARDASDQSEVRVGVEVPAPLGLGLAPVVQQSEALQNYELVSHMKDIYSAVEGAVLPAMLREMSQQVVEAARHDVAAQGVAADLLAESVRQEADRVGREGYHEVECEERERRRRQQEEEERQRKALQEARRVAANLLFAEYSGQFVESCVREMCGEALQEVAEEVALLELTRELPLVCCQEVVEEETAALCREAVEELVAQQRQRVEAFTRRVALRRMAQHFQVWRMQTQKAQRRKESQMTFPAACSSLTLCQQNQALGWGYARDPDHNMSAPQLARLQEATRDALKKLTVRNRLMKECAWHPLPLQHHLAALVSGPPPAHHNLLTRYFKVLVCWEEAVRPEVVLWLRSKLGGQDGDRGTSQESGQSTNQDILQPLDTTFSFVSQRSGLEYAWVLREVPASALANADLRGTALLLFVSSSQAGQSVCRGRVQEMMRGKPGVCFHEMCFEGGQEAPRESWSLVEEDLVKPETSDRLQSLLLESWRQQSERVCVAASYLNDLANDAVLRHFLEPALRRHEERATDGKTPLPPTALIDLYNSVLDTLVHAVADNTLATLSWPPPELAHLTQVPPPSWNGTDARRAAELLASMRLPQLQLEGITTTWDGLTALLHRYAATVAKQDGEAPVLVSHMDAILADTRPSLQRLLCEAGEEEETFPMLEIHPLLAPWPQIIYACASYRLSGLPATTVYYQPQALHLFPQPISWGAACRTSDLEWQEAIQRSSSGASRKRKAQREEEERQEKKVTRAKTVHSKLLDDIASEKQKCAEFEKNLESLLDIEEELRLLFNTSY